VKVLDGRPLPLFPLPSVVLYPGIAQALYVFEPRYREMLAETLDGHGKIAIALLKPGYEAEYYGSPEIHPVVGVGELLTYRTREDGTSDIVLLGECRARIVEEQGGRSYRRAVLVRLRDREPHAVAERDAMRHDLERWVRQASARLEKQSDGISKLHMLALSRERGVGYLVDFVAHSFLEDVADRQRILEELDVVRRARILVEKLGGA
jgi:Lon protease-like protein